MRSGGGGNGFDPNDPRASFEVLLGGTKTDIEQLKGSLKPIGGLLLILGLLWLGMSSFFQLEPEEEAVVLRLGTPLEQTFAAGLHFKIPLVDQVYAVPVRRQHRLEFGFRSIPGEVTVETQGARELAAESLMLTGDLMLVQIQWSLVHKIDDIHAWLFEIKDREDTIRDISQAVMRQVVGDYSLDEVLTTKQLEIASLAQRLTQEALRDKVRTGVDITEIAIREANVPAAAQKAFDDLTRTLAKVQGELAESKADQDNAIGIARKATSEAIGKAQKRKTQAIEDARGEAGAFLAKVAEYETAPDITRQWMYLGTMGRVLTSLKEKVVIEDAGGSKVMKHLPLKPFMKGPGGSK